MRPIRRAHARLVTESNLETSNLTPSHGGLAKCSRAATACDIGRSRPNEVFFAGTLWGRPVSTWVVNLEVRTEVQCPSLNTLQIIVANDDNYALAA
jgi:hypothetical protein